MQFTHFLQKLPVSQSSVFVVILMTTHFVNLIFNLYLGKSLDAEDYGIVTLITSLLYFTNIIFLSMVATVSHTVAYLQAHHSDRVLTFFKMTRKRWFFYTLIISLFWIVMAPWFGHFFQIQNLSPLLYYLPVFSFGIIAATNRGFLQGRLAFVKAGVIIACEALSKLLIAVILILLNYKSIAYMAIPVSISFASLVSLWLTKNAAPLKVRSNTRYQFPVKFFATASLASLSTMAFLSLDIILVKHFFTPILAGQYALLALTGKTIYFLGSLFNNFLIPLVGRDLGKGKNTLMTFYIIFAITCMAVLLGFTVFGLFGAVTMPLFFGDKARAVTGLLFSYCLAISGYTLATSITTYHLAKKEYAFPLVAIVNSMLVAVGLIMYHDSLAQIIQVLLVGSVMNMLVIGGLHILHTYFVKMKVAYAK